MMFSRISLVLAACTLPCGPLLAQPVATSTELSPQSSNAYPVGPGDVLTVTVYRAPDYAATVEVAEDGTVVLSVIGRMKVAGMTPAAMGAEIARRYEQEGIFQSPQVNVMVQTYRSRTVAILGSVSKPGEYPLDRIGLRITEMLARAGASLGVGGGTIRLVRQDGTQEDLPAGAVLDGRLDRVLQPHDTVIVTESATFYISGEVQKPGSYPLEPGLTMGRAIALAGGLTPRGSRNKLKVTRRGEKGDVEIKSKVPDEVKARDLIVVGSRIF